MSIITLSHIGFLCPWYSITRNYLCTYCKNNNHVFKEENVSVSDIEKTSGFPFIVSIDEKLITGSPVFEFNVMDLFEQKYRNVRITDNDLIQENIDNIELMDERNVKESISLCMNGDSQKSEKLDWYIGNGDRKIGFIGYNEDKSKVMMESFLRNENGLNIIDITCLYSNDEKYDFKDSFFNECRNKLKAIGVNRAEIIVGESSYYPNGKKKHFERFGFSEMKYLGDIYLLNRGCDRIFKLGLTL